MNAEAALGVKPLKATLAKECVGAGDWNIFGLLLLVIGVLC
jgi:hypothetical protein